MIGIGTSTVLRENSLPLLIKMKNGRALWSISPAFVNVSCKPWKQQSSASVSPSDTEGKRSPEGKQDCPEP